MNTASNVIDLTPFIIRKRTGQPVMGGNVVQMPISTPDLVPVPEPGAYREVDGSPHEVLSVQAQAPSGAVFRHSEFARELTGRCFALPDGGFGYFVNHFRVNGVVFVRLRVERGLRRESLNRIVLMPDDRGAA